MRKSVLCHMRTTKAQVSLISAFGVRCLDSITPLLAKSKLLRLPSLCSSAGLFES